MRANLRDPKTISSMSSTTELSVDVQCGDGVARPESCDFAAVARRAFELMRRDGLADAFLANAGVSDNIELCVRLVDAAEGEALNSEWRGKATPTNVLSFAADIVVGECAPLGDLVLCTSVVESEAREQGKALGDHYSHLLVHGLLHLLGYDHVQETEAQVMESIEVAVLGELGVANPYE